jgi:hypothetical protein
MDDLYRLGIKVFCAQQAPLGLPAFIPMFHRVIQEQALEGSLIDVADYSHVHHGPGILLIAHEGNYAIDESGGRRGLVYYAKRRIGGSLAERLTTACRRAFMACERLVGETEAAGRLVFSGAELQVFANDRLLAPNTDATFEALRPALEALGVRLYGDPGCRITRDGEARERFMATLCADPIETGELLRRL